MTLEPSLIRQLQTSGFLHVRGVVPHSAISAANQAISEDLAANYDPKLHQQYIHRTFCPDLRKKQVITGLLSRTPARDVVDTLLPFSRLWGIGHPQVAIRFAQEQSDPTQPPWHIDGVPTSMNGMRGKGLWTFTCLVGIFLTTTPRPDAGNFTVWPSSFDRLRQWFTDQGRAGMRKGRPSIDPGTPTQLLTQPGDVVVCHYLMAHAATPNTSNIERRAVFFRLSLPATVTRRYHHLVNPWAGWRPDVVPAR